jgi:hypothetical protein
MQQDHPRFGADTFECVDGQALIQSVDPQIADLDVHEPTVAATRFDLYHALARLTAQTGIFGRGDVRRRDAQFVEDVDPVEQNLQSIHVDQRQDR